MRSGEAKGMSEDELLAALDIGRAASVRDWMAQASPEDLIGYGRTPGCYEAAAAEFARRGLDLPSELRPGAQYWTGHEWATI